VVCGEAGTGREAVAKAVDLRPDIVVLDVSMPGLNGLEATRQIRRLVPAKILILTVHESDQMVAEVLDAGAHGYALKTDAGRTLVEAIRGLLRRGEFFTGRVHAIAARRSGRRSAAAARRGSRPLSPREREVLQLPAEGKSNKEIGTALAITTRTAGDAPDAHHGQAQRAFDERARAIPIRNHIIKA
jgi:DNA-binding NarL/FixJ family response regulator